MQKASNFVIFRLSLEPIAKAHGEKSDAMLEASKLVSNGISQITQKSSNNDALVVVITNKSTGIRTKRDALLPNDKVRTYIYVFKFYILYFVQFSYFRQTLTI